VTVHDDLLAAIAAIPISDETVPPGIDSFWVEISRLCLVGWTNEIDRDAARIASSLQIARAAGATPTDEQIASLEEAFWRVRSATEKVDAVIALAYGPTGLRLYDARRKGLRFDPDSDENSQLLKDIGTETALSLRSARAALEGERATLRRHQLMHSVVPIAKLHDLAPYIVVHHRDGRVIPGGFELSRLAPERWAEGVSTAAAADLFKRLQRRTARCSNSKRYSRRWRSHSPSTPASKCPSACTWRKISGRSRLNCRSRRRRCRASRSNPSWTVTPACQRECSAPRGRWT
jgi:hypothetical protein